MKELKYLLSLSGKHKMKLIFSSIFSIIGTTLSAVPYLLVYQIVLELFKTNIDYLKIKFCVFIAIFFIIVKIIMQILSGVFSHIAAFSILYKIRIDLIEHLSKLNMGFLRKI